MKCIYCEGQAKLEDLHESALLGDGCFVALWCCQDNPKHIWQRVTIGVIYDLPSLPPAA